MDASARDSIVAMTLQVTFDEFAETVRRLLNIQEAYVTGHLSGSLATSAKPDKSVVVATLTPLDPGAAKAALKDLGINVFDGSWLTPEELLAPALSPSQPFIASVAYRSAGDKPGVWVDAFPSQPTQVSVLKAMYDEFRQTGEVDDVTFEDFVQFSNANVVIVSPAEIESFLKQKEGC